MKTATEKTEAVDPEIDRIQQQLQMLREQTQAEEDIANSKILKVQDSIHQFDNVDHDIKAYQLAGGDERLATAKRAVQDLKDQIVSLEEEIMQLTMAISEAESNIANMKQLERNVADNLRYRDMQRDITKMRAKIVELETQNAEAEMENYKEKADKLRKAQNKYTAEVRRLHS
jgi:DNA repair protein RAD50